MAQAKPQTEWEKKYVYKAQGGKDAVLYAGILDIAHQQGLKDIRTMIVQIPTPDNGNVAICCATVILEKDGKERTFQGIGDACPNNVAPAMQKALLRMAECVPLSARILTQRGWGDYAELCIGESVLAYD